MRVCHVHQLIPQVLHSLFLPLFHFCVTPRSCVAASVSRVTVATLGACRCCHLIHSAAWVPRPLGHAVLTRGRRVEQSS